MKNHYLENLENKAQGSEELYFKTLLFIETIEYGDGSEVKLRIYLTLTDDDYHWQYRTMDIKGTATDWVEFGTPGNVDFTVWTQPIQDLPTLINGVSEFGPINVGIYIGDSFNFTFIYTNELGIPLTDLSDQYYSWKQYDEQHQIINSGSDFLIETVDHYYILDFDTETRIVVVYIFLSNFTRMFKRVL
ncbi:hypothetical protein ES703_113369 [subsurface metagenome]